MSQYTLKDNATSSLLNSIIDSDMTIDVSAGEGSLFPSPTVTNPTILTLVQYETVGDRSSAVVKREKILVTARSGDTFTISERGVGDTTAQSFNAGDFVDLNMVSEIVDDIYALIDAKQSENSDWQTVSATYGSSLILHLTGVSVMNYLQRGSKIALNQTTGGTKFWHVYGTSTNNTVRFIPNNNYTLNAETINSASFSNGSNPKNWPGYFNYSTVVNGYTTGVSVLASYSLNGNRCTVTVDFVTQGYSNSNSFNLTLPAAARSDFLNGFWFYTPITPSINLGAHSTTADFAVVVHGTSTAVLFRDFSTNSWGVTGAKAAYFTLTYKI